MCSMLDYKMIVNIALGIVLGAIVIGLGGALMHKVGGGKDRMMYGKEKGMMMGNGQAEPVVELQVETQ